VPCQARAATTTKNKQRTLETALGIVLDRFESIIDFFSISPK